MGIPACNQIPPYPGRSSSGSATTQPTSRKIDQGLDAHLGRLQQGRSPGRGGDRRPAGRSRSPIEPDLPGRRAEISSARPSSPRPPSVDHLEQSTHAAALRGILGLEELGTLGKELGVELGRELGLRVEVRPQHRLSLEAEAEATPAAVSLVVEDARVLVGERAQLAVPGREIGASQLGDGLQVRRSLLDVGRSVLGTGIDEGACEGDPGRYRDARRVGVGDGVERGNWDNGRNHPANVRGRSVSFQERNGQARQVQETAG